MFIISEFEGQEEKNCCIFEREMKLVLHCLLAFLFLFVEVYYPE